MKQKKRLENHFNLLLPKSMRQQLDRVAQKEGRTLSSLVRFILNQELQRRSFTETNIQPAAANNEGQGNETSN